MPFTTDDIVRAAEASHREERLRKDISEAFLDMRVEAGWSQREAALYLETPQQNISRLEKGGTDLRMSTLQKFAAAYGYEVQITFEAIGEGGSEHGAI